MLQVKHRFRFFCSGNEGASAAAAIAAAVATAAPAAPSATAGALPIAGANPALNDSGLGDDAAATDELEAVEVDVEDAGG